MKNSQQKLRVFHIVRRTGGGSTPLSCIKTKTAPAGKTYVFAQHGAGGLSAGLLQDEFLHVAPREQSHEGEQHRDEREETAHHHALQEHWRLEQRCSLDSIPGLVGAGAEHPREHDPQRHEGRDHHEVELRLHGFRDSPGSGGVCVEHSFS